MHGSSLPQDESAGPCRECGVQLSSELQSVECCGWPITGDKKVALQQCIDRVGILSTVVP